MARTKAFEREEAGTGRDIGTYCYIYCPGCDGYHSLRVRMPRHPTQEEIEDERANRHGLWTWNGNTDLPTFRASLLCNPDDEHSRCHSFITDGRIQFLGDCWHGLKNQTVDLPEIDL